MGVLRVTRSINIRYPRSKSAPDGVVTQILSSSLFLLLHPVWTLRDPVDGSNVFSLKLCELDLYFSMVKYIVPVLFNLSFSVAREPPIPDIAFIQMSAWSFDVSSHSRSTKAGRRYLRLHGIR